MRYPTEGDAALKFRPRRSHTRPETTASPTVDLILDLRYQLAAHDLDAGADTIAGHLNHHRHMTASRPTIHRITRRRALHTT